MDVFRERMDNMVVGALSTIPLYQGIPLDNYPKLNAGIFENKGVDINVELFQNIHQGLFSSRGTDAELCSKQDHQLERGT